jgi:DNA invertase Pin-like site-specific DNA recombinase
VSGAESGIGNGDRERDAPKIAALIAVSGNPRARRASRITGARRAAVLDAGELTAEEYMYAIRQTFHEPKPPAPDGPLLVFGYLRVSTDEQAKEGTSLAYQERKVKQYCAFKEYRLAHIYVDDGVSWTIPLNERPQGKELCLELRKGDHVVMARHDRGFTDRIDTLVRTQDWLDSGIICHFVNWGLDTSQPFWNVAAWVMADMAAWDWVQVIAARRDGQNARRHIGERYCLWPPMGFKFVRTRGRTRSGRRRQEIVLDEPWMGQMALVSKRRDEGMTLWKICKLMMARREKPLGFAKSWSPRLIHLWIKHYKSYEVIAQGPPLLNPEPVVRFIGMACA